MKPTDSQSWATPGAIDLTNCDREPIHLLGGVQPIGFLIGLSTDWIVTRVSANVEQWLGQVPDAMLGCPLRDFITPDALDCLLECIQALRGEDAVERVFGIPLQESGVAFDIALHRSGETLIIECEPAQTESRLGASHTVRAMLPRLERTSDFKAFCREAARQVRNLTGFDRVMVYRFDRSGAGEVIGEAARPGVDSFLGLHYPATDIPAQARALYIRNLIRIIADVDAPPSPVLPQLDPRGEPLDLSMSTIRSVSPIHLEYLRNMGVRASFSISILNEGKLWGLFACHHYEPRHLSLERRTAAELFGQMFSLMLESRERNIIAENEARARSLHNRLMSTMAAKASSFENITRFLDDLGGIIACDGIGAWIDGQVTMTGLTPTKEEFAGIVRFLNRAAVSHTYALDELGAHYPPAKDFLERTAGILAIPISRTPRDYLVFFRKEAARTVTWAGNPSKPVTLGPNGPRLTPRKSFEAWQETVRGQSLPWSPEDERTAEALRITLLEVILRLTDVAEKERKRAQERQELLIAELNHRVRNILSLIRALVAQSQNGVSSVSDFAAVIGGRVQALGRAHDLITADNWGPASVTGLIHAEVSAYINGRSGALDISGEDVLLEPEAFSALALVVHELTTNSVKYGALSSDHGVVRINLLHEPNHSLALLWQESGGPPVRPPSRRGFGSTVIERSIAYDLGGETDIDFNVGGVKVRLLIPARFIHSGRTGSREHVMPEKPRTAHARLSGRALVVEDNMIIAMDAEDMLQDLGVEEIETASSVGEALRLIERHPPDFALLDVNLGTETSFPVADALKSRNIPYVFTTGYGESLVLPGEHAGVPIINKPYTQPAVVNALAPQE